MFNRKRNARLVEADEIKVVPFGMDEDERARLIDEIRTRLDDPSLEHLEQANLILSGLLADARSGLASAGIVLVDSKK